MSRRINDEEADSGVPTFRSMTIGAEDGDKYGVQGGGGGGFNPLAIPYLVKAALSSGNSSANQSTQPSPAATQTTAATAPKGGIMGFLGSLPGMLAMQTGLGLLGNLGGKDDGTRKSFDGTAVDPVQTLQGILGAILKTGDSVASRASSPVKLRNAFMQPLADQGKIDGLPFQIGGGFATDPALADPSLLEYAGLPMSSSPFADMLSTFTRQANPRRNPTPVGQRNPNDVAVKRR